MSERVAQSIREVSRAERWTALAWLPFVLLLAGAVYLGMRPGGTLPVQVYQLGPLTLALTSLVGLIAAVAWCTLRRPFLRPGRMIGFAGLAFTVLAATVPFSYPSSHARRPSQVEFTLPVAGEWAVRCGGEGWRTNVLAFQPARCFGYDLVRRVDAEAFRADGSDPEDWYAWGAEVRAPAAGEVFEVVDDEADRSMTAGGPVWRGGDPYGNRVGLRVAESEFLFLTHLRRGSVRVAVGDRVEAGELLAEVGNSGLPPLLSAEPHLGLHLQDTPEIGKGEGIPLLLHDVLVEGVRTGRSMPTGGGTAVGQRVEAASGHDEPGEPEGPLPALSSESHDSED